jgi:hypothetical protein
MFKWLRRCLRKHGQERRVALKILSRAREHVIVDYGNYEWVLLRNARHNAMTFDWSSSWSIGLYKIVRGCIKLPVGVEVMRDGTIIRHDPPRRCGSE